MSRQSKGEHRRLKQRERRQKWRNDQREIKAEAEKEAQQKTLDLASSLPECLPTTCTVAEVNETVLPQTAKRHRLSPKERTLKFFIDLFKYDTRPADWDLVCINPGEYTTTPYQPSDPPLSRLSALVWETEYETQRLTYLHEISTDEAEYLLTRKERELKYYRKHIKNRERMYGDWPKYLGRFGDLATKHLIKVWFYGNLVLWRVITQLEFQKEELVQRIDEKCLSVRNRCEQLIKRYIIDTFNYQVSILGY
ncbi:hypothetical protein F4801DRAFT_47440 [Xylaria longipes]|nr:hypothetical protein F4801DRAFT_47440 [Xylaria longipes]